MFTNVNTYIILQSVVFKVSYICLFTFLVTQQHSRNITLQRCQMSAMASQIIKTSTVCSTIFQTSKGITNAPHYWILIKISLKCSLQPSLHRKFLHITQLCFPWDTGLTWGLVDALRTLDTVIQVSAYRDVGVTAWQHFNAIEDITVFGGKWNSWYTTILSTVSGINWKPPLSNDIPLPKAIMYLWYKIHSINPTRCVH